MNAPFSAVIDVAKSNASCLDAVIGLVKPNLNVSEYGRAIILYGASCVILTLCGIVVLNEPL